MDWINDLYAETEQKWKEAGSHKSGYAIFYSPVDENKKIVLIGYNPGGGEEDFIPAKVKVPQKHEYLDANYKMANNIRKIFKSAGLNIEDTIKFNLIFFRSTIAKDLKNKELVKYSEEKVLYILNKLKPELIITEGFATFERLLKLTNGKQVDEKKHNDKAFLIVGETQIE